MILSRPLATAFGIAAAVLLADPAIARSEERLCPMIYRPVCAIDRYEHKRTFGNRCEAEAASAHVLYEGVCRYRHHHT